MRSAKGIAAVLTGLLAAGSATAGVNWSIGVRLGFPFYGPCYAPYYRPYPVVIAPAPVVLAPAQYVQPVPVAPAPAYAPAAIAEAAPPAPPPVPTVRAARPASEAPDLAGLNDPSDRVRRDAILALARRKDRRALEPIARLLREDQSAEVREAAARGLGLIGSPASLPALQNAAQVDDDRDVRRSAAFSAEVIRANLPR
jgi:hypothetical protein